MGGFRSALSTARTAVYPPPFLCVEATYGKMRFHIRSIGAVGAQLPYKQKVAGSNPASTTMSFKAVPRRGGFFRIPFRSLLDSCEVRFPILLDPCEIRFAVFSQTCEMRCRPVYRSVEKTTCPGSCSVRLQGWCGFADLRGFCHVSAGRRGDDGLVRRSSEVVRWDAGNRQVRSCATSRP